MKWMPMNSVPPGVRVLILWADGHVEDATFHYVAGQQYYALFDGEQLKEWPIRWMPYPELDA